MTSKRAPADLLKQMLGRQVSVKINQDVIYIGTLICLDGQMNLCLQNIEEYKNKELVSKHEQIFVRGNNVTYISTKNTL